MALYHHDGREYNEAASEAARRAREKLEAQIERGRKEALAVIEKVEKETPADKIVRVGALQFKEDDGLKVGVNDGWELLHRNALGQMAEKAAIPMAYVNHLNAQGAWGRGLLADNFRELFGHREKDERYLTRSVNGELRAFLSNKYRRLSTGHLLETAFTAFQEIGVVPVDGIGTDTRVRIRALLPIVFEPVPNEIVAYGLDWGNSDFGNGAHVLSAFMLRLWCTNFATTESVLREVHLGQRLSDDIAWSDKTFRLDTERSVSMLRDAIAGQLAPAKVEEMNALVKRADEEKVDARQVTDFLKKHLGKGMAERVGEAYRSNDVENLPPGNTRWRLSNALSWIAGQAEDKEDALDLQRLAGRVLEEVRPAA